MTYWYVDSSATGSPSNGTTRDNAWRSFSSITQASLNGGDIVYVFPGSGFYNERWVPTKGGTSTGSRIIYKGISTGNTAPILAGINSAGVGYLAFLGIQFTQGPLNLYEQIRVQGCTGWLIQDCNFSGGYGACIDFRGGFQNDLNIVRSNIFQDFCAVSGGQSSSYAINLNGSSNLAEYNVITSGLDRVRAFGTGNIVRNNYMGATDSASYFKTSPYPFHTDGFQSFEGALPLVKFLYEKNYDVNNTDSIGGTNAHGFLVQDAPGTNGFFWEIIRFYTLIRPGGGGYSFQNVSRTYVYNNTFIAIQNAAGGNFNNAGGYTYPSTFSSATSASATLLNTTFSFCPNCRDGNGIVTSLPTGTFTGFGLHLYNTGSNQCVYPGNATSTTGGFLPKIDPLFVDGSGISGYSTLHDDYRLQAISPLRWSGYPITYATNVGNNSNIINVKDSWGIIDGWGIVDADFIKIGISGTLVRVSGIDYNSHTITLKSPLSWNTGDGIYIKGMEDIGSQPFSYVSGINVINTTPIPLSSGIVTLSATTNAPNAVRKIEFLVDGFPVGESYESPYQVTYNSTGGSPVIEARAYNMWASPILTVSAFSSLGSGVMVLRIGRHIKLFVRSFSS